MRVNPAALPLEQAGGERFPLLAKIKTLRRANEARQWPVWVRSGGIRIPGRVCAIRKTQTAIEKAHRKLERKQQKKQRPVSARAREFACYVVVFTTLPSEQADAPQVMEYYRLRWQIELTFKRLKSIAHLGHVPKSDDDSSRAWLYGKLFLAPLSEKLIRTADSISPWGYPTATAAQFNSQPLA